MKEREERVHFQKGFKFEASWLMDKEYNNIIKDWAHGHANGQQKLSICQTNLKRWSTRKFGHAEKILKKKTKELELLQQCKGSGNVEAIKILKGEIEYILE
jgi:hypothetical protein